VFLFPSNVLARCVYGMTGLPSAIDVEKFVEVPYTAGAPRTFFAEPDFRHERSKLMLCKRP
jgi:hypothetical protein